jgi:hypothetical protein
MQIKRKQLAKISEKLEEKEFLENWKEKTKMLVNKFFISQHNIIKNF